MSFNQGEVEFQNSKHERSSSEIIFEGSTLAQYLQEQEVDSKVGEHSDLHSFSEQTLITDYFPSFKTIESDNNSQCSDYKSEKDNNSKLFKFSPKLIYSNFYNSLKTRNFKNSLKDLITASTQINLEFYNLIDDSIEKIEFFGWLNTNINGGNNWKLKSNLVNFENYCVMRPKTLNLLPMSHRYLLSSIFVVIVGLLVQFGLSSRILNCTILIALGVLFTRFYNLNYWYSNLTQFCQNLNQFLQIYLELEKDFNSIINWATEIELVSKGFRSGIKHDYSGSSIDEENRELLLDSIKKLKDSFFKVQLGLIKEFDLPYTAEELENLQNLPSSSSHKEEDFTWLTRIKLEYEKLFISRKTLLNLIFNLVKFKLVNLEEFLRFFNFNFNQLSLTGNGIKIQLKEVFNINNSTSPNTSLSSNSFDNSLLRHHRKKSSLLSMSSSSDEDQMNALIKLNKSLNSLELEMRTWFAKFHVINSSISNISQSTTLKNDPEETQKVIEGVINEFKQMSQSITILNDSSKRSEQLLKEWSESFTNDQHALSPSLTLIEEEECDTSPKVNTILEINKAHEVFDCETEPIQNNLENLLTTEPECFEIEALPPITPPELLVKTKLTREERIRQNKEKRKSEQRQNSLRPNVTQIVQELNTAIRSHQLKMETFRIKPTAQRPKSTPPSRDNSHDNNQLDNTEVNLRPNTSVNFEIDRNNNNQSIKV